MILKILKKSYPLFFVFSFFSVVGFGLNFSYAQNPGENAAGGNSGNTTLAPAVSNEAASDTQDEASDIEDPFISSFPVKKSEVSPQEHQKIHPMEASAEEKFDMSSLTVTGLVWGTDKPKAIVNGEVVGVGDTLKDAQILNINAQGILLKYKDKEYLVKR